MLTTRGFHGQEFFVYCQQQFDEARRFLKNCGKPRDEVDRFMIDHNKVTAKVFGGLLDMTDAVNEIKKRNELVADRAVLLLRVDAIDAYLRPTFSLRGWIQAALEDSPSRSASWARKGERRWGTF